MISCLDALALLPSPCARASTQSTYLSQKTCASSMNMSWCLGWLDPLKYVIKSQSPATVSATGNLRACITAREEASQHSRFISPSCPGALLPPVPSVLSISRLGIVYDDAEASISRHTNRRRHHWPSNNPINRPIGTFGINSEIFYYLKTVAYIKQKVNKHSV